MKKILFVFCLSVLATSVHAQFNIGLRAASTFNKLRISNADTGVETGGVTVGYQLGIYLRSDIPGTQLSIQPEILYAQSSLGFELLGQAYELDIDKWEVPVLLMTQVGPLRLEAGPSFGIIADVRRTQPNGTTLFVRNDYESFTMGYQLGIGIDVKSLVFDLRYGEDVNSIGSELDRGFTGNQRQTQVTLAIGYKIL